MTSLRTRRAALAVSSSASTTIWRPTLCRPPANLSRLATSALRQQVRVTGNLLSSSLTLSVIAMGSVLPPWSSAPSSEDVTIGRRETQCVMTVAVLGLSQRRDDEVRTQCLAGGGEPSGVLDGGRVSEHDVHPQLRRSVVERLDVTRRREPARLGGV